jgi:hypothetical protein
MAGGYTNLDKVRPAGYRRFVDDAASPPQPDQQQQYEQVSIGSMSGICLPVVFGPMPLCLNQGDQIGRIFAYWRCFYFGQFFQIFLSHFSLRIKLSNIFEEKNELGCI